MKNVKRIHHGAHKSAIIRNTVLYVPFDGNVDPLVGKVRPYSTFKGEFIPSKTGEGLVQTDGMLELMYDLSEVVVGEITIDLFIDFDTIFSAGLSYYPYIFCLGNNPSTDGRFLALWYLNGGFIFGSGDSSGGLDQCKFDKPIGKHFVRCVYSKSNNYMKVFIDGKLVGTKSPLNHVLTSLRQIQFGNRLAWSDASRLCALSELSNVRIVAEDLGDTFDYLPISTEESVNNSITNKPTRQIPERTDVASSFIKEVRVPSFLGVSINKDYDTTISIDGLNPCKYDSSICVKAWASNSNQIMIRDLESFIITGVLDSNTALCTITKYISGATVGSPTIVVEVDNVSKLSLKDILKLQCNNFAQSVYEYTVSKIEGNIVTLSVNGTLGSNLEELIVDGKLFEITQSSSVPTIVTEDNKTVVGTWKGLGTRKAIFTFEGSDELAGKDLYVTYCINTFRGRSPYNGDNYCQPQEYLGGYDEFGNELVPVDSITIVDDFSNKISDDLDYCKHYARYSYSATRPNNPQEFTFEISGPNRGYPNLASMDDNVFTLPCNPSDTGAPKLLCAFNVIDIIERKLGYAIPARDKIQWIKDNVNDKCNINIYGFGMSGETPLIKFLLWNCTASNWGDVGTTTTPRDKKSKYTISTNYLTQSRMDKDGYVYFVIFTDKHLSLESKIVIDYINIEISLKIPTGYTALWVKNNKAKECPCNPILCNPVTKAVTRMIPNKEPFTLDISASNPKITSSSAGYFGSVFSSDRFLCYGKNVITSLGSGSDISNKDPESYKSTTSYAGAIGHALQDIYPSYVFNSESVGRLGRFYTTKDCYIRDIPKELGVKDNFLNDGIGEHIDIPANNFVSFSCFLFKNTLSEINLGMVANIFKSGKILTKKFIVCGLPNTPLEL